MNAHQQKKCLWSAGSLVWVGEGDAYEGKTLPDLLSDPWVMGTLETPLPVGDSVGRRVVKVRRRHGKHFSPPRPQECASLRVDFSLLLSRSSANLSRHPSYLLKGILLLGGYPDLKHRRRFVPLVGGETHFMPHDFPKSLRCQTRLSSSRRLPTPGLSAPTNLD